MASDTHLDAEVLDLLERVGWSNRIMTGVGRWVLLDLSTFGLALCQAVDIVAKDEMAGFVGVDFDNPKNVESLEAFARHIEAGRAEALGRMFG